MKLAPEIMNEVFDIIESPYPLINELRFKSRNVCTVRHGIETAAFVGSRIWSYMPSELKKSMSLNVFRLKIKTWRPENCPCKLCKISFQRIGCLQVTNQYLLIDTIIYVSLFVCVLVLLGFFAFLLPFAFFPHFNFNPLFKVELNQPHIVDKGYICSLIYFLSICIFYWSIINK